MFRFDNNHQGATIRTLLKLYSVLLCVAHHTKTKLRGLSPRANYTDRAAAADRRS